MVEIDLIAVAEKMGTLAGAARADWANADPADVGVHGVPVKQWRDAYFVGCKDMAEAVAAALPEAERERVKEIVQTAFTLAFNKEVGSQSQ